MLDLRLFLPKRVPLPLIAVACLLVVGSWIPLALILHYTQVYHERPRIHLFQDMDNQPKLKAQAASPVFNDGRAMRQPVAGTIARGHLAAAAAGPKETGHAEGHEGPSNVHGGDHADTQNNAQNGEQNDKEAAEAAEPTFVTGFPEGIDVDEFFLARGQEKFNTFCYPCHGKGGHGNGPVNQRAASLQVGDPTLSYGTSWTPAANLVLIENGSLLYGEDIYPNGHVFQTITHGKNNMAGYGHAIPVEDRWAIVAYVRALQLSQAPEAAVAAMDAADQTANPNTTAAR